MIQKTSNAFVAASWIALGTGTLGFLIGLWRSEMLLNEKGYYFTVLMFGLFSVISLQKSVRDKLEGIPVTEIYYSISWFATILSILLLIVGLWNATLLPTQWTKEPTRRPMEVPWPRTRAPTVCSGIKSEFRPATCARTPSRTPSLLRTSVGTLTCPVVN